MAINEYMSPNINQHQNTHVDTYEPINFQFLNGQLEKKQTLDDTGEAVAQNITDNIKINPYFNEHKLQAQQIKDSYRSEIDSVLQESGGNYAVATPKLQQIGRRLAEDLQYGNIARINNATNSHLGEIANIKEIAKKSGINELDQLNYLNREAQAYDTPENAINSYSPFNHGQRIDFNGIIDKTVGNIKSDSGEYYNLKDPNYIKKFSEEYIRKGKVYNTLHDTLKDQSGIEYEAALAVGIPINQVTEQVIDSFIDNKIKGIVEGVSFSKKGQDLKESAEGSETGRLNAEQKANPNTSINQDISIINPNGKTPVELKDNYNNINSNTLTTINRTLDYNGLSKISYVGPDGKDVIVNAAQIASDSNAQTAIKSGNFKAYDKNSKAISLGDSLKNSIVSNLTKQFNSNDSITNDISSSVNEAVNDLIPGNQGITIPSMNSDSKGKHLKGGYINNEQLKKLALQKYTGKKQMEDLYFNEGGYLMKKVNGEEIAVGTSPEFNKIFHSVIGDPEIIKQADTKLAEKTNRIQSVTFAETPENSIGVDTKPYYKSVDKTISDNVNSLSWKVPGDPTNGTDLPLNEALAKSLGLEPDAIKSYKLVTSTGNSKDPIIAHSSADVNGMDLSRVNFTVDLGDGVQKTVVLNVDKNNQLNSGVLNMQKADPSYKADRFIKSINSVTTIDLSNGNGKMPVTINPNGTIDVPRNNGETQRMSVQEFFAIPGTLGMLNSYINSTHR